MIPISELQAEQQKDRTEAERASVLKQIEKAVRAVTNTQGPFTEHMQEVRAAVAKGIADISRALGEKAVEIIKAIPAEHSALVLGYVVCYFCGCSGLPVFIAALMAIDKCVKHLWISE